MSLWACTAQNWARKGFQAWLPPWLVCPGRGSGRAAASLPGWFWTYTLSLHQSGRPLYGTQWQAASFRPQGRRGKLSSRLEASGQQALRLRLLSFVVSSTSKFTSPLSWPHIRGWFNSESTSLAGRGDGDTTTDTCYTTQLRRDLSRALLKPFSKNKPVEHLASIRRVFAMAAFFKSGISITCCSSLIKSSALSEWPSGKRTQSTSVPFIWWT